MMAAYQPQPGVMQHPGMAPHGHPAMTPGQPMNPAQMQQMGHPGVSGPGQPHVTQAGAMMGMQPGANGMVPPGGMGGQHPGAQMGGVPGQMGGQSMPGGVPNAHAMSHLTPQAQMAQQQQIIQQMQQQQQSNPHLAMQQHQQAQQMAIQRRMAAMQAGNMNGMQQNAMQGLNPQQLQHLQQMQQNNPGMHPQSVQLPQHLQAQQIQLMRQQQAAQQNQLQQQIAMQQQNSNQGAQPGPPNQQGGQAQHPGNQMRPQSRMANPNEQNQATPQQAAQQPSQGQQQQQQQQGQAQQQQQGQQQNPQQQGQQQQMTQQQMAQLQQQRRMQMQIQQQNMQRQIQAQAQAQAQQFNTGMSGQLILRFMQMCDGMSAFSEEAGKDIDQWRVFVDKHFSPDAELMHFVPQSDNRQKGFKVPRSTIARYFQLYFDSGAQSIRLHAEQATEQPATANRQTVIFQSATLTVAYANGARLEMVGTLSVRFVREATGADFIEHMELHTTNSEELIKRADIEQLLNNWSPTMGNKAISPKMTKNKLPKAQQKLQSQFEGLTIDHFPKAQKGNSGITWRVHQFLEIGETFNLMSDLMAFAQEKRLRPEAAIDALVSQYQKEGAEGQQMNQQGNPQINLPPNGVPVGNRTPSMQHMQIPNMQGGQFSSPSVSNLSLPMQNGIPGMNGSPHISNNPGLQPNMNMANSHTPSPHQSNMAAPPMVPQHSQQGTNSSAASANTSPNVNNKRRRSTVKMEGDEGGGDSSQGANRVKPSPRMGKKSKPGGA